MIKQTTLGREVETSGLGLHTGVQVRVRLRPAPPDTGYIFLRGDLDGFEIPASVEHVSHSSYATTLMRKGVTLSTVEHLLAALRGEGVDNAYVEVDNLEVPIMDGSSEAFTELIEGAGVVAQPAARLALRVRKAVTVTEGARRMSIEPHEGFEIDCLIEEIDALRRANLIRGGSLDNAIVLTRDGMLNETPLRAPDEFVRHKVLDIIGDLALVGMLLLGLVRAERSGHLFHAMLMTKLLRDDAAWEVIDMPSAVGLSLAR